MTDKANEQHYKVPPAFCEQVLGRHYSETAEAWLQNLDHHRNKIRPVLQDVYGLTDAGRWLQRCAFSLWPGRGFRVTVMAANGSFHIIS